MIPTPMDPNLLDFRASHQRKVFSTKGGATMSRSTSSTRSRVARQRAARGFTLVELLVGIAIIGILVSLMLPAIQAAREAARRTECNNNLKQIGLGMQNYHSNYKCFPPGSIAIRAPNWTEAPHRTNWAISLLPYIEEQTLYDLYKHHLDNTAPENKDVREQYVPTYSCPSDIDGGRGLDLPCWGRALLFQAKFHYGSYVGVAGAVKAPYYYTPDRHSWNTYMGFRNMPENWRGVFHIITPDALNMCESASTITDGLSNTLAVGERHRPRDRLAPTTNMPLDRSLGTFWAYSVFTSTSNVYPYGATLQYDRYTDCVSQCGAPLCEKVCFHGPWFSYHAGVHNWLMCDGSVHSLGIHVDMNLLFRLASVADGETAQVPR